MLSSTKTKTALSHALILSLMVPPALLTLSMFADLVELPSAQAASDSSQPFLKAIDPSTAQLDAPPPPQAETMSANNGSQSGGQSTGQFSGGQLNNNPLNSNPFNSNIQGRPLGQASPPVDAQASADDEARITKLEKQAFGSTYNEHEAPDRLDHLEKETFGAVRGGPLAERIGRLEQKLFGGGAFNAHSSNQPSNQTLTQSQSQPSSQMQAPAMLGYGQSPAQSQPQQQPPGQSWQSGQSQPQPLGQSGWQTGQMPLGQPQPLGQSGWQTGQQPLGQSQGQSWQAGQQFPSSPSNGFSAAGGSSSGSPSGAPPASGSFPGGWTPSAYMPNNGGGRFNPLSSGATGQGVNPGASTGARSESGSSQVPAFHTSGNRPAVNAGISAGHGSGVVSGSGSGAVSGTVSGTGAVSRSGAVTANQRNNPPGHNAPGRLGPEHSVPVASGATKFSASGPSNNYSGGAAGNSSTKPALSRPVVLTSDSTLVANSLIYDDRVGDYLASIRRFPGAGGVSYARWKEFPVRIKLPENSPESWQRSLESQVARWNSYIPLKMTLPAETADIETVWVNQLPPRVLGVTRLNIVGGQLKVWIYLLRPSFYPPTIPERTLSAIFAREVGHSLGLFGQSERAGDLMSATGGKREFKPAPVSARDINTLKRLYEAPAVPTGLSLDMPMEWATTY